MLDTHAIARSLTDAGADTKLADAITNAVLQATEQAGPSDELIKLIEGVYYAKTDAKEALTRLDALAQELRVRIEHLEALATFDQRLARVEGIITGRRD